MVRLDYLLIILKIYQKIEKNVNCVSYKQDVYLVTLVMTLVVTLNLLIVMDMITRSKNKNEIIKNIYKKYKNMSRNISIEEYTAKSFVVRGETQPYKESLKAMSGKWNSSLTDRNNGEKFGAWLFWSDKRSEVTNWLKKDCPIVEGENSVLSNKVSATSETTMISSDIIRLEKKLDHLINLMEKMFSGNEKHIENDNIRTTLRATEEYDDENIDAKPVKRLLRRK